jgi:hypothetical protein
MVCLLYRSCNIRSLGRLVRKTIRPLTIHPRTYDPFLRQKKIGILYVFRQLVVSFLGFLLKGQ